MLPNTVDEIDAEVNTIQARADCTMPVDKNVLEEYNRREREIRRLTKVAGAQKAKLDNHQGEVEQVKAEWLDPLKDLIGRINDNFAYYFSTMKCAGEVDLSIPDNPVSCGSNAIEIN